MMTFVEQGSHISVMVSVQEDRLEAGIGRRCIPVEVPKVAYAFIAQRLVQPELQECACRRHVWEVPDMLRSFVDVKGVLESDPEIEQITQLDEADGFGPEVLGAVLPQKIEPAGQVLPGVLEDVRALLFQRAVVLLEPTIDDWDLALRRIRPMPKLGEGPNLIGDLVGNDSSEREARGGCHGRFEQRRCTQGSRRSRCSLGHQGPGTNDRLRAFAENGCNDGQDLARPSAGVIASMPSQKGMGWRTDELSLNARVEKSWHRLNCPESIRQGALGRPINLGAIALGHDRGMQISEDDVDPVILRGRCEHRIAQDRLGDLHTAEGGVGREVV